MGELHLCPSGAWTSSHPLSCEPPWFQPVLHALPSPLHASGPKARGASSQRFSPGSSLTPGSSPALWLDHRGSVVYSFPLGSGHGAAHLEASMYKNEVPPLSGPCLQFSSPNSVFVQICQPALSRNRCAFGPLSDLFPRPTIFFLYSMLTSPEIEVRGTAQESFFGHTGLLSLPRGHFGVSLLGSRGPLAVMIVVIITARRRGEWQV